MLSIEVELLKSFNRLVFAISGGKDSMALLHFAINHLDHDKFYVITVHHNLRGKEGQRDRDFVVDYCKNNGIEIVKMTDLIELSKKECPELEESFEEQKVKLCKILDDIRDIERKNVELLKHNLIMSDKLLDIIISAAMPQTDNYNMHGKNSKGELSISSIVEDA